MRDVRASERTCVHACMNACVLYESVCFTDVKADPGLRVQVAAVLLFALMSCKIPVGRSLFVAVNAIGESPPAEEAPVRRSYQGGKCRRENSIKITKKS